MKRLLKFLLWTLVFCALLLAVDQTLLRVPLQQPALAAVRSFYLDFRQRLIHLGSRPAPASIDAVIEQAQKKAPPAPGAKAPEPASAPAKEPAPKGRYLYVDGHGELQFADRLEDIPPPFRREARRMER